MRQIIFHVIELNQYILYLGIKIRVRIRPKGTKDDEVLEMSNEFWMMTINGIWITNYVMPVFITQEELILTSKNDAWLILVPAFLLKYALDYYTFYKNKKWKKIIRKFDVARSKKIKTIYLIIFLILLVFSFINVYYQWMQ